MAAAAGGGGQGQQDNSTSILWGMAGIFCILFFLWYAWHAQIVTAILYIKEWELYLVGLFNPDANAALVALKKIDPASVDFNALQAICAKIGNYLKYPIAIILGIFALILFKSGAKSNFRTTFNMNKLLLQEKENWPQISPVAHLDLVNEDIDAGKWAMAENPIAFFKKHKLVREELEPIPENSLAKDQKTIAKLVRPKAFQVLARQLGRPWQGPDKLKIYARALFAIFAAKAEGDREVATNMLRQIAASSEHGKLDFSGVDELLKKHRNSKIVAKINDRHAYELTMMATLLEVARLDGVLASAEFLWLKPVDRQLWYMLNTVGRRVAPIEVAGPYSHWLAEKGLGRKLTVPMVEQAIVAMEIYLTEIIYTKE